MKVLPCFRNVFNNHREVEGSYEHIHQFLNECNKEDQLLVNKSCSKNKCKTQVDILSYLKEHNNRISSNSRKTNALELWLRQTKTSLLNVS